MNKIVHKKLTEKNHSTHAYLSAFPVEESLLCGDAQEMRILDAAAKDLMQPRPEAIARLLKLAKDL